MKRLNFLPLFLLAVVVAITATSCMTAQGTADDNYDRYGYDNSRQMGNRVYIDDPYRGTVVLERDPYSGRYYDVTNAYNGYGYGYSPYNSYRNYRNYSYRTAPRTYSTQPQQPTEEQRRQYSESREEARRKVLGSH